MDNVELLLGLAVLGLIGVVLYGVRGTKKTEDYASVVEDTPVVEEKPVVEEVAPVKKPRKARAPKMEASVKKPRKTRSKKV